MARAVVIGGGHNGLIAAVRLARAGWAVTLCERRTVQGGLAAPGPVGDRVHTGWLPHTAHVAPEALAGLDLGLSWRAPAKLWGVRPDGSPVCVDDDPGWQRWASFADHYREMAREILTAPAPRLRSDGPLWPVARAALGLRRLGNDAMMDLLRVAPTSAEDALSEHIDDPTVRAVAAGAALLGSWMGPLSPTGAAGLLLDRALRGKELDGGGPALVAALESAAQRAGVQLRTGASVVRVRLEGRRVAGVDLDGGEQLPADCVVAACDPRTTLLQLVRPQDLPVRVEHQAQEHRVRGLVAVVHLALKSRPSLAGQPVELLHSASHPHEVERAFDGGKGRRMPVAPPVLLRVAPDGRTATAWMHGISAELGDGAGPLGQAVLERTLLAVERVWPQVRDEVEAHEVHTPADLERRFGLAGGHLWHGEIALDQLWSLRPGLDLSGHRTPIGGLFLASGGTHPTGGLTGLPGHLAARAVGPPGATP